MQFKNFFDKKNILRFIMLAIIIFLLLPIIFPEKTPLKILKQDSIYTHEDSPLPIFPKDNPIKQYTKRFKKFYNIGGEQENNQVSTPEETVEQIQEEIKEIEKIRQATKAAETYNIQDPDIINITDEKETIKIPENHQTIEITAEDLFFSDDYEDKKTAPVANPAKQADTTTILPKEIVKTKDGLILHPTQDGYYYKNKFYKNGTYPKNADKRHIEGALSRYHNRVAKRLGKKAVYFADEQGNLTVSYVNELPEGVSADIDTYRAKSANFAKSNNKNNFNSTEDQDINKQYQHGNNNLQDKNMDYSDIASASIKSMHAAYNLAQNKINNGQMTQGIDINKPFENAVVNNFLNNNNTPSNEITPDNPAEPPTPPANPEESDTVLAGDKDFAQNYADKIHELNCGKDTVETLPSQAELVPFVPAAAGIMQVGKNNFSCDTAPLIVEQSSSITNTVSQESDLARFTNELNGITTQSDKTDINIISTDRNFYPVASKLNNEESIRNNNDAPVTVHIIGPNEHEADLSKVLESVTYSITDDTSVADKLTDDLTNFYALTQEENAGTNTILAFPTEDENKVFILTDPNNSYWLKNPSQLESLPAQYMEKNGVYYKGVIVDKTQIGDLVQEERTNLLYVSDKDSTHALQNGSVLTTVKEEDIKINSLHPQQIQQNAEMIRTLTEKGQQQLSKEAAQQPGQQPIEIIDFEKGNKIIQPES